MQPSPLLQPLFFSVQNSLKDSITCTSRITSTENANDKCGGLLFAELMVLGFISLFLSVFQQKVASLCMAERLNRIMLPCKYVPPAEANAEAESPAVHRRLFAVEAQSSGTCSAVIASTYTSPNSESLQKCIIL